MNKLSLTLFSLAVMAGSIASAQEPTDTLKDVKPFGTHVLELIREAGVEVISSPGAPGMTPTIFIHGLTIRPGMEPVYVVDGLRTPSLEGIAPESIESIQILKDASALGTWGPEASAGVVLVTTRRASQKGFHAGYSFTGGFQSLAHEPKPVTLEDWRKTGLYRMDNYFMPEQISPETAFLQNYHLYAQYGGEKWSGNAGMTILDNDGPHPGRKDTHQRYAAYWQAEYRPLKWLSMETTGRWNDNRIHQAEDQWLEGYLAPTPRYDDYGDKKAFTHYDQFSETVLQGKIEIRPLPGLYLRGVGEHSWAKVYSYEAGWLDTQDDNYDRLTAASTHYDSKWYQWGIDAGWSGQWKGHHLNVEGRFRRLALEKTSHVVIGEQNPNKFGLQFADDAHVEEYYLDPAYAAYIALTEKEDYTIEDAFLLRETYGLRAVSSLPYDVKWKETGLSVGYDWKDRYKLGFSYYKLWENKMFTDEGYEVPAVTLGWSPSEEPLLRLVLPTWWKRWSFDTSWSKTNRYIPVFYANSWLHSPIYYYTSAARRDLRTSAAFQFGNTSVDLSAGWYINDDNLYRVDATVWYMNGQRVEREPQEEQTYSIRNRGWDVSASVRGVIGQVRYSASSCLSFYRNKVSSSSSLGYQFWTTDDVYPSYFQNLSYAFLRNGESVGGQFLHPKKDVDAENYENSEWMGSAFPTTTGSIRLSAGWKNWQLTVSGHGRGGNTLFHINGNDALTRYFLENIQSDDNPDGKLQASHFYQGNWTNTEYALHSASFFRIDQIRLDYTLPVQKARLNFFASLENWFLFTKYPGSDPELALTLKSFEKETAYYPSTRRTIFGVSVDF